MPILSTFACFTCRKVFKQAVRDAEVCVCPECAEPMSYTGTAFRAPKQTNVDQWKKAELLISAGILFIKDGGPRPRNLKDVPAFLEAHRLAARSPGERLLDDAKERAAGRPTSPTRSKFQGRVTRTKSEGRPRYELLGRELTNWCAVLIKDDGRWRQGRFRHTGDGGKLVEPHVEVDTSNPNSGPRTFITVHTVLRWPD
jgi:hypothetical protein